MSWKTMAFATAFSFLFSMDLSAGTVYETSPMSSQWAAQQTCSRVCSSNGQMWNGHWWSTPCSCSNNVPNASWCECVRN